MIKNNTQISKTDYSGDYIYQGDQLQMIMTPENATTHVAVILQEDHFDPYGMKLGGLSTATNDLTNKYLYQGKEFQDEGVDYDNDDEIDIYLNWYDFDARFFDVQLARWHVPDPAGQCASPYAAMGNNPVSMADPSGMAYVWSEASYWHRKYIPDHPNAEYSNSGHLGPLNDIYFDLEAFNRDLGQGPLAEPMINW